MSDKMVPVARYVGEFLTLEECALLGEAHQGCGDLALAGNRWVRIEHEINVLKNALVSVNGSHVITELNRLVSTSLFRAPSIAALALSESGMLANVVFHLKSLSREDRAHTIGMLFLQNKGEVAKKYFAPIEVEMVELRKADISLREKVQGTPYQARLEQAVNEEETLRLLEFDFHIGVYDATALLALVEEALDAGDVDLAFDFMYQIRAKGVQEKLIAYLGTFNNSLYLDRIRPILTCQKLVDQLDRLRGSLVDTVD